MAKVLRWLRYFVLCVGVMSGDWLLAQKTNQTDELVQTEEAVVEEAAVTESEVAPDEQMQQVMEAEEAELAEEPVVQEPDVIQPEEARKEEPTEESAVEPSEEVAPISEEEPRIEAEQIEPQPPLGPDEVMGIDTVDLEDPQGNWLYKRVWWERAEAKYEKIRSVVNKILEMRTIFFAQRAELDKTTLDPFYIKIGLSQGELQEILAGLIAKVTKTIKEKQDEQILEQAEADKLELEQLHKEVQQVVKQDEEVENAILMLVEQINKIRRLEQEAWQNFKSIARVLDDKKARELFYKIDNAWRNIQELQSYIEQTFSSSFNQLIERIQEKIKKIDSEILSLKERGFDLKQRIMEQEIEREEEKEEAPKGMLTRYILDPIKYVVQSVWQLVRWPFDKIMGKSVVAESDEQVIEEEGFQPETQEEAISDEEQVESKAGAASESPYIPESASMTVEEESEE